MQRNTHPGRVENYTNPFLGTLAVILFMAFWVIAAVFGFVWVALTSAIIDIGIKRLMRPR